MEGGKNDVSCSKAEDTKRRGHESRGYEKDTKQKEFFLTIIGFLLPQAWLAFAVLKLLLCVNERDRVDAFCSCFLFLQPFCFFFLKKKKNLWGSYKLVP